MNLATFVVARTNSACKPNPVGAGVDERKGGDPWVALVPPNALLLSIVLAPPKPCNCLPGPSVHGRGDPCGRPLPDKWSPSCPLVMIVPTEHQNILHLAGQMVIHLPSRDVVTLS